MRTAGIICECNPLHAGHLRVAAAARESGADTVVALMSGCFVQRGEAAVADPYTRAEILVRAGFDAVFELPFPYSASSAEFFGRAGVDILARLGVDELWFGSESGDLASLSAAAAVAQSQEFIAAYTAQAQSAGGTAQTYFDLLQAHCASCALKFDPNDILALSYLRAIAQCAPHLTPHTIRREGSSYRETALAPNAIPSATALRAAWETDGLDAICIHLPKVCAEVLLREQARGLAPASLERAERAILTHLRLLPPDTSSSFAELGGGLGDRVASLSHRATSLSELISLAATKKYPDARVRRGILYAMLGIGAEDLRAPAAYVRLLAANRRGCAYLATHRRKADISVVTRKTDLPLSPEAQKQFLIESRERAFYALCRPSVTSSDALLSRTPFILEKEIEKNPKK